MDNYVSNVPFTTSGALVDSVDSTLPSYYRPVMAEGSFFWVAPQRRSSSSSEMGES